MATKGSIVDKMATKEGYRGQDGRLHIITRCRCAGSPVVVPAEWPHLNDYPGGVEEGWQGRRHFTRYGAHLDVDLLEADPQVTYLTHVFILTYILSAFMKKITFHLTMPLQCMISFQWHFFGFLLRRSMVNATYLSMVLAAVLFDYKFWLYWGNHTLQMTCVWWNNFVFRK